MVRSQGSCYRRWGRWWCLPGRRSRRRPPSWRWCWRAGSSCPAPTRGRCWSSPRSCDTPTPCPRSAHAPTSGHVTSSPPITAHLVPDVAVHDEGPGGGGGEAEAAEARPRSEADCVVCVGEVWRARARGVAQGLELPGHCAVVLPTPHRS